MFHLRVVENNSCLLPQFFFGRRTETSGVVTNIDVEGLLSIGEKAIEICASYEVLPSRSGQGSLHRIPTLHMEKRCIHAL
jgi:hypothetical protein